MAVVRNVLSFRFDQTIRNFEIVMKLSSVKQNNTSDSVVDMF
jgi:hypothetical protein